MYNYGEKHHYEYEVLELMGLDFEEVDHCGSCHSDDEMGYDMPEHDIPEFGEGHYANLCCKVGELYEKWHKEKST